MTILHYLLGLLTADFLAALVGLAIAVFLAYHDARVNPTDYDA